MATLQAHTEHAPQWGRHQPDKCSHLPAVGETERPAEDGLFLGGPDLNTSCGYLMPQAGMEHARQRWRQPGRKGALDVPFGGQSSAKAGQADRTGLPSRNCQAVTLDANAMKPFGRWRT